MNEEDKIVYTDLMMRFRSLDEEEQKDLLWIVLSSMDSIAEMAEKAKKEGKKKAYESLSRDFQHYQMFSDILMSPADWMREINMDIGKKLLKHAREQRTKTTEKGQA